MPHVYQLLLKIGTGSSWKDALLEVLPKKKLNEGIKTEDKLEEKNENPENHHEDDCEDDDEAKSEDKSEEKPKTGLEERPEGS